MLLALCPLRDREFTYFEGEKDKTFNLNSMKKYANTRQELDKRLEELITPVIKGKDLKIIDIACGIGHIIHLLSEISQKSHFHGIDQTPYLIEEACRINSDNQLATFEVGDIYNLADKYRKCFDISISWKVLSWLPYYDEMLKALLTVTKNHVYISSLFYDGDIDFEIKVREYKKEQGKQGFNSYYNVYSLPHFKDYAFNLGVKNIEVYNFDIGIDLPKPPIDQMGTYTIRREDGKRFQISGAVVMYWKIIKLDL